MIQGIEVRSPEDSGIERKVRAMKETEKSDANRRCGD